MIDKQDKNLFKLKFINYLGKNLKKFDLIIFGNAHTSVQNDTPKILIKNCKKNTVIFDGRRYFNVKEIKDIKKNNLKYIGIGRS